MMELRPMQVCLNTMVSRKDSLPKVFLLICIGYAPLALSTPPPLKPATNITSD